MSLSAIAAIAVGLSVDSFVLALSCGMSTRTRLIEQALRVAVVFAVIQAGMTLLGWSIGVGLRQYIQNVDHWIAFGILAFIGAKMLVGSLRACPREDRLQKISNRALCAMGMATSIDALAVGAGFAFLPVTILPATAVIGAMTFLFALYGVLFGRSMGCLFGTLMTALSGVLLIGIGLKILLEHLAQN